MNRIVASVAGILVLVSASQASAQTSNHAAPVVVGHFHLNVTNLDEHKKFWVDTLGGTAIKWNNIDVIKFPDTLLFLRVQPPTGPTRGTAFDHIGFAVPDVPALTARVVANGYKLTTGREPAPGQEAAASAGTQAPYGRFAYLLGPDGVKVELVTAMEITLTVPYRKVPALNNLGVAFITDPWGTYIELTEGLNKVE